MRDFGCCNNSARAEHVGPSVLRSHVLKDASKGYLELVLAVRVFFSYLKYKMK